MDPHDQPPTSRHSLLAILVVGLIVAVLFLVQRGGQTDETPPADTRYDQTSRRGDRGAVPSETRAAVEGGSSATAAALLRAADAFETVSAYDAVSGSAYDPSARSESGDGAVPPGPMYPPAYTWDGEPIRNSGGLDDYWDQPSGDPADPRWQRPRGGVEDSRWDDPRPAGCDPDAYWC
jgi:hypothetical protein